MTGHLGRSPRATEIVLYICPECGGYEPLTTPDYAGHLTAILDTLNRHEGAADA